MGNIYSSDSDECPHCFYTGEFQYKDLRVNKGIEWLFYRCPNCCRWVVRQKGEQMCKLFDLPFIPLHLTNGNSD